MFLDELARVLRLKVPADEKIKLAQREMEKIILAEEELERQRLLALHERYVGMEDLEEIATNWFSNEETIDLSVARKNKLIWDRPFRALAITELTPSATGVLPVAYIRLNQIASASYRVRSGSIKGNFSKLYLTNTVQAGLSFKFVISQSPNVDFGMIEGVSEQIRTNIEEERRKESTEPLCYNITMALADTEYDQVLPTGTKRFKMVLADGATFRLAKATGLVATPTAPYWTQPANIPFESEGLYLTAKTLYFASPVVTKIMQIWCWK